MTIHVTMYMCIKRIFVCMFVWLYVCMHVLICLCMYACMHARSYARTYVRTYVRVCMYEEEEIRLFNIVCSYTNSAV